MSGSIHPFPQYAFMAWCSVKAQGQLYLNLYHRYLITISSVLILSSHIRLGLESGIFCVSFRTNFFLYISRLPSARACLYLSVTWMRNILVAKANWVEGLVHVLHQSSGEFVGKSWLELWSRKQHLKVEHWDASASCPCDSNSAICSDFSSLYSYIPSISADITVRCMLPGRVSCLTSL
jgi:hypothetical protein